MNYSKHQLRFTAGAVGCIHADNSTVAKRFFPNRAAYKQMMVFLEIGGSDDSLKPP